MAQLERNYVINYLSGTLRHFQVALELDILHESKRKISKPISTKKKLDLHKRFAFSGRGASSAGISVSIFAP